MIELLSPAGDKEALVAAIRNGADAVYLGGQALNARRGANNFDEKGLCWATDYCHERGRKIYVTVNTLVKQQELYILEDLARQLSVAGVDAAILSDFGAYKLFRQLLPSLPLHASTQMAVHNRHGVRFLKNMGFDRCVLARELMYSEIADCVQEGLPIEVFCHGALCVSCSGQCLFSSLVGGRSGNRGMCAQPCRLPYSLNGFAGHLLSPKDLMTLSSIPTMRAIGVQSLKIEGRLKRPEYVAIVTRIYREMLDNPHSPTQCELDELLQVFNRGAFTRGYGEGVVDNELMHSERPNHCGLQVGRVAKGRLVLDKKLSKADQLVWRLPEQEDIPYRKHAPLPEGAALIRLTDDEQLRKARRTYEASEQPFTPLVGEAMIRIGEPLSLKIKGVKVQLDIVKRAQKTPTDPARVKEQLEKTGGTPYCFQQLDIDMDQGAFVPVSQLNDLRRNALAEYARCVIKDRRGCEPKLQPMMPPIIASVPTGKRKLCVQTSNHKLLASAREWGADECIYEPRDLTNLVLPDFECALALPMTSSDQDIISLHEFAMTHKGYFTGVLVSNPSQLALDWPGTKRADYSLNIANSYAIDALGLPYAPSVELTVTEINELPGDKELIVYGRLPLMQLKHCPLNARLEGVPHASCSRCDSGHVCIDDCNLIDRKGVLFPLSRRKTLNGCIVQVLNSVPLMLLKHIGKLPKANAWRIILTDESLEQAEAIVRLYRMALDKEDFKSSRFWSIIEPMETTTGHYFRGVE